MKAFSWTFVRGLVPGIDVGAEPNDMLKDAWGTCLGVPVHPSLCPHLTEAVFDGTCREIRPVGGSAADNGILLRLGLESIPDSVDDRVANITNLKLEAVAGGAICVLKSNGYGFESHASVQRNVMFQRSEPWLVVLPVGAHVVFGFHGIFRPGTLKLTLENQDGQLEGLNAFENTIKC